MKALVWLWSLFPVSFIFYAFLTSFMEGQGFKFWLCSLTKIWCGVRSCEKMQLGQPELRLWSDCSAYLMLQLKLQFREGVDGRFIQRTVCSFNRLPQLFLSPVNGWQSYWTRGQKTVTMEPVGPTHIDSNLHSVLPQFVAFGFPKSYVEHVSSIKVTEIYMVVITVCVENEQWLCVWQLWYSSKRKCWWFDSFFYNLYSSFHFVHPSHTRCFIVDATREKRG